MPGDQSHVTNRLAQFVAGAQWETIPPEVRREGVRGLLNFVGCALGGAQDEAMGIAVKVLTPFFGPPQGIVIGRGDRPDALNAAFLNAVSANALEYLTPETEAIDRVVVRGHPLMRERTDRPNVETGRDARVSLQHTVAAAFLFGAAGLAQYEDHCVADPAVRALCAKVVFEEDRGAPVESATVTLHLADGTEQSEHIRHGRGTPGRPMSDAELDSKVRELAAYGAPFVDAVGLIAAVRGIEGEADPSRLMRLTVPA